MGTYPVEITSVNGRKYVKMDTDIFLAFFNDSIKYTSVSEDAIDKILENFAAAKKTKKKRISKKKQKQVLTTMYTLLHEKFIKSARWDVKKSR